MAHDVGGGPGGDPSRGPGIAARRPVPNHTCPSPSPARPKAPRLVVDLKKGKHRISPLIYGVNFAEQALRQGRRPAGQPMGRQQHRDLQLAGPRQQPRTGLVLRPTSRTAGARRSTTASAARTYSAADAQVQQDRATKTATLLTLPLLGWVANAVSYAGDHPCSYPASYNPQDDHDPYHSVCGNGRRNGQWLTADPTTAGVQVGPAFSAQWIAALKAKYGDAQHGGVAHLRARQRAGALGRHPPRLPPPAHDVRRALDEVARPRAGGQGRRPGRGHARSGRVGLAQLLLLGRRQRRPGLLPDLARTAPHTAAPSSRRGTSSSSRPTSSRPAAGCSTTSTCTTTRRASTPPSPT